MLAVTRQDQNSVESEALSSKPEPGDPDYHRKFEAWLDTFPEPTFEERFLAQQVRWAQEAGGPLWVNTSLSVGMEGYAPERGITYAFADRKDTAFITPVEGWGSFRDFAEVHGSSPFVHEVKERVPLVIFAWMFGSQRRYVYPSGRYWDTGGIQRLVFNCAMTTCRAIAESW